jgi:hypothetical protein
MEKAMPDKGGFTIAILPHDGKRGRHYDVSGWKQVFFRAAILVISVIVIAAAAIVVFGVLRTEEAKQLSTEVSVLQDSLEKLTNIDMRLSNVQRELEEIREARIFIENLATMASGGDSI